MDFNNVKYLFKNNKMTENIYVNLREIKHKGDFRIESLQRINPKKNMDNNVRLNIILPVFNSSQIYGGISTALKIFNSIVEKIDCAGRIIITGSASNSGGDVYNEKLTYKYKNYKHNDSYKGVFFLKENNNIEIGINDFFIVTSWNTAYIFESIFTWQKKAYSLSDRKYIYLIQDYEPGFYPWSTEYVLAEDTYHTNSDDIIAIFNSNELKTYMEARNYTFYKNYCFSPVLNESLKNILLDQEDKNTRKKKILIYGRPNSQRNAYELLKYSLMKWSHVYKKSKDWEVISLGEKIKDVKMCNGCCISFKGKLSLEEYANEMLEAYAGVSLMVSPHPSYVPLELSTFGVRTITNEYENKNLSYFNDNIISINSFNPNFIVNKLIELCENYELDNYGILQKKPQYLSNNDVDLIIENVIKDLLSVDVKGDSN